MAVKTVQGAEAQFLVRDYGSTSAYQEMVCEETLQFEINNDVNTAKTKCGTYKGVQTADMKASGSGVCNVSPTGTEYSYDELQNDQIAVAAKEFVIQNRAYGSTTAGNDFRWAGVGYFVGSQWQGNNGDKCKFSWNFEVDGALTSTSES
jgi:hypothetical protein